MKIENNKKIGLIVVGVLVLIGAFYGGVVYGKSQVPTRNNLGTFSGRNGGLGTGSMRGGGFTTGQIISKDANSITVTLMSGGSKIIFLDSNTKIAKEATGTISDLSVGTQVSVTGATNSDGSVNATTVQIRPNMPQGARVQ